MSDIDAAGLDLLRDMRDGEVWYQQTAGVINTRTGQDALGPATRLRRARLADVDFDAERLGSYPYVPTAAGEAVLASAEPAGQPVGEA